MTEEEREARKRRRLLRKQKRGEKTEKLISSPTIKADCLVCGRSIKPGQKFRRLPPDERTPEWRYYHEETCGPGTEAWFKFHPSPISKLMMESKEKTKEKRLERRERRRKRKGGGIPSTEAKGTKPITQTRTKEDTTMSKKEEKKATKKGEHLKPMTPVIIPPEIVKKQSKEVQALLKQISSMERSSSEAAKIRKSLRKLGFKLSEFREENGKGTKKGEEPKKGKKTRTAPPEEDGE